MQHFTNQLQLKVDQRIRVIETQYGNTLDRSLAISNFLEQEHTLLKDFISGYTFQDTAEEILFFREIKPRLTCKLLFYRQVSNIEINRPMGSLITQEKYFNEELDDIADYLALRQDFYRYFRSGATHNDEQYFTRSGRLSEGSYRDLSDFERDPAFSSPHDFTVAKILSYDLLHVYLREELDSLGRNKLLFRETPLLPVDGPRWTDKKVGLIQVLYGFYCLGSFDNGRISLRKLQEHFEQFFDIRLGNITRTFNEMKIRSNPTSYLESMARAIRKKMDTGYDNN